MIIEITSSGDFGAADLMRYNIVITDPAKGQHSFDLLESQIPAEMLDLINRM